MARVLLVKGVWSPDAFAGGYMPPLWPMTIAGLWRLTGESLLVIRLFNLMAWGALLAFTYFLTRPLAGRTGAWLAAVLLSWHELFYFIPFPQYEILLALLCVSGLWAWLLGVDEGNLRWFVLAGGLWGMAGLVQTRVLPVPLLLMTVVPMGKRTAGRWRGPLLCLAIICLFLLPFAYRNWRVHGHLSVTPGNFGVNLWIGNNPEATGLYMSPPRVPGVPMSSVGDVYERDHIFARSAMRWISSNPATFLFKLVPKKLYYLWHIDKPINWILLPLAAVGAILLWQQGHRRRVLALAYPVVFVSMLHALFFGAGRFRFWALPDVHIFAACALVGFAAKRLRPGAKEDVMDEVNP